MRREKRKINKLKVGIVVFIFVVFILTTSGLGRFVYNVIRDKYLTSKKFYFESNLLKSSRAEYIYKNWDGTGIYNFEVELLSKINDLQKLEDDQEYTIMVTFPQEINCAINEPEFIEPELYEKDDEGNYKKDKDGNKIPLDPEDLKVEQPVSATNVIYLANDNKDVSTIYVKKICDEIDLKQGDRIEIDVTAYTSNPYKKSLTAKFIIEISTSYTIEDSAYSKYAMLTVRNTSNVNQLVTIKLPNHFLFDMNDDAWVRKNSSVQDTDTYRITSVTFELPQDSSKQIKLYKTYIYNTYTISNCNISISKKIKN